MKISHMVGTIVMCIALSACAEMQALDRALYSATDAISDRDRVTGELAINFKDREEQIKKSNNDAQKIVNEYRKNGVPINEELDQKTYARLTKIFDRVHSVSHLRNESWTVILIPQKGLNAFVLGGTYVFVYSGLFEEIETDDEIAAVIGHELAHVAANHRYEREAHSVVANLTNRKSSKMEGYREAYSSNDEKEADRIGVTYAALAGYDPFAASQLWGRISNLTKGREWQYYQKHPVPSERAPQTHGYAEAVSSFYTPSKQNPRFETLLNCNTLWCQKKMSQSKGGNGQGLLSLVETLTKGYTKHLEAKSERYRQDSKIINQRLQSPNQPSYRSSFSTSSDMVIKTRRTYTGMVSTNGNHKARKLTTVFTRSYSGRSIEGAYKVYDRHRVSKGKLKLIGRKPDGSYVFDWKVEGAKGQAVFWFSQNGDSFRADWVNRDDNTSGVISGNL